MPNGKKSYCYKQGDYDDEFIIQHPFFFFGSYPFWSAGDNDDDYRPIYHQQFRISKESSDFELDKFLSKIERNWYLEEDESLWFQTGFWTVNAQSKSFMGVGINSLELVLNQKKSRDFALCLSNNDSVILISSSFEDHSKLLMDIYASNEMLPFVEVVEPFRKAIMACDYELSIDELTKERDLRKVLYYDRRVDVNPIASILDSPYPTIRIIPVVENKFQRMNDLRMKKIHNMLGRSSGGFAESDYDGGSKFHLYAEIFELETASVIEFYFEHFVHS